MRFHWRNGIRVINFDFRVDVAQPVARRFKFAAADIFCSVKNLPLQIGEIDTVEIDKPKSSHTGCCQIQRGRGTQTTGANAKNTRCLQSFLPSAVTSGMMRCRE